MATAFHISRRGTFSPKPAPTHCTLQPVDSHGEALQSKPPHPSSSAMSYQIDDGCFPLVLVTWTGTASAESTRAFFADLAALTARAEQAGVSTVTIHDARESARPSPDTRAVMAEQVKTVTSRSLVDVVVLNSAALRGVITAMAWVVPGPMKRVKTAATLEEAFDLAQKALAEAGQAAPPRPAWANLRRSV